MYKCAVKYGVTATANIKIFEKGDAVLVFNSRMGPHPGKMKMRWLGPYRITNLLGTGTFTLATMDGVDLPKPINGFRLKPYYGQLPRSDIKRSDVTAVNMVHVSLLNEVSDTSLMIRHSCKSGY